MDKRRVLSLIRATGRMHLGNYLGAIHHFVELDRDERNECYFGIASLHTLTTLEDPESLRASRDGIVLDFLAAGIDPERSVVFDQSAVFETTMLAWLLGCLAPMPELLRMGHLKDKAEKLRAAARLAGAEDELTGVNAGLVTYPVLMAADILGPRAHLVPVGEDQHQHVEFAREIARRFNLRFCESRGKEALFPVPELLPGHAVRVPGLGASGKMGKSEDADGTLFLSDPAEVNSEKLRRGMTDPARKRRTDPGDPENCPVGAIYQTLDMLGLAEAGDIAWVREGCTSAAIGCIECKRRLHERLEVFLAPFRERRAALESRGPGFVEEVLRHGNERARAAIRPTVLRAMELMGLSAGA